MTVQEAILKIHAPKGVTTVLAGVMSGDYSVLKEHDGLSASLSTAQEMVDKHQKQLNECQSDWAYWGILGDLTYWEAVRNILEAGTLNGGVLADVPGPYLEGLVVMDSIGKVGDFGKEVLSKTKQLVAILYDDTPEKEERQEDLWREVDRIFNVKWTFGMPDDVMQELKEKFKITRKQ